MRNTVVAVDSGLFVALFNRGDTHHPRAVEFSDECRAEFISNMACVTEAMYLLQFHHGAQYDFLNWVQKGSVKLIEPTLADFGRVNELMKKYSDLPMDFTDALLVSICERLDVQQVATVDSDFEIYRFKGRGRFVNLF